MFPVHLLPAAAAGRCGHLLRQGGGAPSGRGPPSARARRPGRGAAPTPALLPRPAAGAGRGRGQPVQRGGGPGGRGGRGELSRWSAFPLTSRLWCRSPCWRPRTGSCSSPGAAGICAPSPACGSRPGGTSSSGRRCCRPGQGSAGRRRGFR